jgi:hypothetical protein
MGWRGWSAFGPPEGQSINFYFYSSWLLLLPPHPHFHPKTWDEFVKEINFFTSTDEFFRDTSRLYAKSRVALTARPSLSHHPDRAIHIIVLLPSHSHSCLPNPFYDPLDTALRYKTYSYYFGNHSFAIPEKAQPSTKHASLRASDFPSAPEESVLWNSLDRSESEVRIQQESHRHPHSMSNPPRNCRVFKCLKVEVSGIPRRGDVPAFKCLSFPTQSANTAPVLWIQLAQNRIHRD